MTGTPYEPPAEQHDPHQEAEQPAAYQPLQQPEQPEQPERPQLPRTGDETVDEALEPLLDVQDLPPAEQVEVYVGVHRALQDRLADLEG